MPPGLMSRRESRHMVWEMGTEDWGTGNGERGLGNGKQGSRKVLPPAGKALSRWMWEFAFNL